MLTLALAATLVGFVLLVLGLITGTVWLAIACIVICLVGLGFLIADIVGAGRRGGDERSLEDFVATDDAGADSSPTDESGSADGTDQPRSGRHERAPGPATWTPGGGPPAHADPSRGGGDPEESSSQSRGDRSRPGAPPAFGPEGGSGPRPGGGPQMLPGPSGAPGGQGGPPPPREGTYDDYLRSVGGFTGAPPRPVPPSAAPPGAPPRRYAPEGERPAGAHQRNGGSSAESFSAQRPEDQRPGDDRPDDRRDGSAEPRTQRFDPLDPNWRPPLD